VVVTVAGQDKPVMVVEPVYWLSPAKPPSPKENV
jgi:hypothetical protein